MFAAIAFVFISGCGTGSSFNRRHASSSPWSHDNSKAALASSHGVENKVTSKAFPNVRNKKRKSGNVQLVGFSQDEDEQADSAIKTANDAADANDSGGASTEETSTDEASDTETLPFDSDPSATLVPDSLEINPSSISLNQVLVSVSQCYPEIDIAIGEIETANGKVLASWGEFDRVLEGHSISQPLGFYQTYRNGVGLTQPLYGGGEIYGTYRIGDGNFEPWYGERETNEAGELKAGLSLPLLKDRNIDKRRAKLLASQAQRDQVESKVQSRLLKFQRFATQAYWDWVASGQAVQIQRQLLELAETRVSQIKTRVESGDLAEIAQIDNDRLIAKRKNDLIKARRSLEKSAIKLSLFWRDPNCNPVIASEEQLPIRFPGSTPISTTQLNADIETAFSVRPELVELKATLRETNVDRLYAENLTLPKLDVKGFAGQDLGGETSSLGDKTPFELQVGVFYEVPLERRKGLGKIQSANGKLTQIDAKIRLTGDKIRAELQDAASAVNAAFDQIQQSTENVRLTKKSLELGLVAFEEGDIDLITLNIYEAAVATAELELLNAQFKYFFYQTVYETAKSGSAFDR